MSAWICSHSAERVAPPPAVISVAPHPASRIRSITARVPKPIPSSTARNRCAAVWCSDRPTMAPRESGSVYGVRLPWKWSSASSPSAPGSSRAACSFNPARSTASPVRRRSQAMMEPVEVWPPSRMVRPG